MPDSVDKPLIIRAIISEIKSKGQPLKIEARDIENYTNPPKLKLEKRDREVIPDLVVHYDNHADLYEVELEDHTDIEKWRQMLLHAKRFKGHLFLVVPDFLGEKIKDELTGNAINAGLIYFNTG